ncbi:MAG TPA: cupin domain-containing protein [Chloroflexota bacterium]|nr:cupin domain-containing protein [Chloroflexota bacterium]
MRGSKQDLPVAMDDGGVAIRQVDWGDMTVSLERFPAGLETAPIFKGLPDDRCQCEHWGYVVSGRVRVLYKDREETLTAGDAYYLPPGHTTVFEEPTELVEYSPRGTYLQTMEVAARNVAAMKRS